MLLCTDRIGIKILLKSKSLNCKKNKQDAIETGEMQITKDIKNKNYNTIAFYEQTFDNFNCYKERFDTIFYKTRSRLNFTKRYHSIFTKVRFSFKNIWNSIFKGKSDF